MNRYIEIRMQSPADGAGFVAQWYAGGERSGQAFALSNVGELLFFAFFAEVLMVIPTMRPAPCCASEDTAH